jgi:hypothetical protein
MLTLQARITVFRGIRQQYLMGSKLWLFGQNKCEHNKVDSQHDLFNNKFLRWYLLVIIHM